MCYFVSNGATIGFLKKLLLDTHWSNCIINKHVNQTIDKNV